MPTTAPHVTSSLVIWLCSWLCSWVWLLSLATPCVAATPAATADKETNWGWQLPQKLSDSNTTVRFEVDSTWHLVQGKTSGIGGNVWLSNPRDALSVKATINFPVARFSTGGEMRDERMREVMDEEHSHYVTLSVDSISPKCSAREFNQTGVCAVDVHSRLSIRGNERHLLLNSMLRGASDSIELAGKVQFSWLDFGVEDPSILVAKLEPNMSVEYSVKLPRAVTDAKTSR